jgi:hypothetical protein
MKDVIWLVNIALGFGNATNNINSRIIHEYEGDRGGTTAINCENNNDSQFDNFFL